MSIKKCVRAKIYTNKKKVKWTFAMNKMISGLRRQLSKENGGLLNEHEDDEEDGNDDERQDRMTDLLSSRLEGKSRSETTSSHKVS